MNIITSVPLLPLLLSFPLIAHAQIGVTHNKQKAFPQTVPAGNYSGICWLGGNEYAVVSDKSEEDGFFIFEIRVDSVSGDILSAQNLGFKTSGTPNRDGEGIAFCPRTNTIFISGEADNYIKEYSMDGRLTGRSIPPTPLFSSLPGNLGLEALSYNDSTRQLWTCNESGDIFLQSYGENLQPEQAIPYSLDSAVAHKAKAQFYAHGIGTICALDDGSLLVLEREFFVPKKKIGSFVNCKLFHFNTTRQSKVLLTEWRTSLSLLRNDIANYEGMCLGPTLADGSRVILLVADSQNQYGHVLKDWIKSLKVTFHPHQPHSHYQPLPQPHSQQVSQP